VGGTPAGPDPVTSASPVEDIGAATLSRYQFQAALVAARCVHMMVDDRIKAIICEWHEDYVVQFANGSSELVSVKHHDGDQLNWTVKQLCEDGGLKHLFHRWSQLGESVTCRLQTNEHMRTGKDEPAALRDACAAHDPAERARWAKLLSKHLGTNDLLAIERFLSVLVIEDRQPDRHTIHTFHVAEVMPQLVGRLSLEGSTVIEAYEDIRTLALDASSEPGREVIFEALADPAALSLDSQKARTLAAKTLDRTRVLEALTKRRGPKVLLSARLDATPARTRLVKKLEAGGAGPTGMRSAQRLRANWSNYESAWSPELPGQDDVLEHLRTMVVRFAGEAEGATRRPGEHYAAAMTDRLTALLAESDLHQQGRGPLTTELLLGLAFDRTEACEIYWSDPFDPDTVA
jgi:hypothetical protein